MAFNDIYYIEDRLKEIEPAVQRIDFDRRTMKHKIIAIDKQGVEYTAMTVPLGQLDARVVHRMQEIDPKKGYRAFDEVERLTRQRERNEERKVEDMAHSMADMLHKPLIRDAFY